MTFLTTNGLNNKNPDCGNRDRQLYSTLTIMKQTLETLLSALQKAEADLHEETKHFHPIHNCPEGAGRVEYILYMQEVQQIKGWVTILAELVGKCLDGFDGDEPKTEAFIPPPEGKKLYFNLNEIEEISLD